MKYIGEKLVGDWFKGLDDELELRDISKYKFALYWIKIHYDELRLSAEVLEIPKLMQLRFQCPLQSGAAIPYLSLIYCFLCLNNLVKTGLTYLTGDMNMHVATAVGWLMLLLSSSFSGPLLGLSCSKSYLSFRVQGHLFHKVILDHIPLFYKRASSPLRSYGIH